MVLQGRSIGRAAHGAPPRMYRQSRKVSVTSAVAISKAGTSRTALWTVSAPSPLRGLPCRPDPPRVLVGREGQYQEQRAQE